MLLLVPSAAKMGSHAFKDYCRKEEYGHVIFAHEIVPKPELQSDSA